jgi:hypothetical protein
MQVIPTTTQAQSAEGEAKVRAGRRDVEKAFERMRELQNRCPKRFPEMLVPQTWRPISWQCTWGEEIQSI